MPQSTYRRADGFFLVYDPSKPESIDCLREYITSVHESSALGEDAPLVILGVSSAESEFQEVVENLALDYDCPHFIAGEAGSAHESFKALQKAATSSGKGLSLDKPSELFSYLNVDMHGNALPKDHGVKRFCSGGIKC